MSKEKTPPANQQSRINLEGRELKIAETLSRLVKESPYNRNRRPIWEAVGVTSAALSQYLLGQSKPRIDTLVALAEFFGVTLDFLILGREAPKPVSEESQSIARYVDFALSDLQEKIGRRSYLTARVGQLLVEQIEVAVDRAQTMPIGGMLTVEDGMHLERHSLATDVWNSHFEYDTIQLPSGEMSIGRYGPIVADNLMRNPPRPYRFLLTERPNKPLAKVIHAFKRILREELGVSDERLRFCQFRKTQVPTIFGGCFYKLDMPTLLSQEPALAIVINEGITPDGRIACSSSADDQSRAEILLRADRVEEALLLFNNLWREAEPW